ncbi:MAG TPA: hypothetical protein VFT67_14055 [Jatrophihabitantaceae bacterium]|nr:hypothetical protein [Jatrophihabitantaceae bacterium]
MTVQVWARAFSVMVAAAAAAVGFAPLASATTAGQPLLHTDKVVVRPVHRDGRPVHGYRVVGEHHQGFTCEFHSPVSVSSGVAWCGSSADATIACWKSQHHTVLCLRDPRLRELVRIRYSGTFRPGQAVNHPIPEALVLRNDNYCTVRIGGAWGTVAKHPNWIGYYSCSHAVSVYGPRSLSGGIDRSVNPWRVHLVTFRGDDQLIRTGRVAAAYYVGTAK